MDDIEELQDRADRSMRTISSVGGALANKFAPKKSRRVRPHTAHAHAPHTHTTHALTVDNRDPNRTT